METGLAGKTVVVTGGNANPTCWIALRSITWSPR
jgi:hypothetical protein